MRIEVMVKPVLLLLLMTAASLTVDGAPTLPSGMENPLVLRYPELATAPAPSWLTEGTRATYSVIASTPESEYSEKIEWTTGSTGHGLSQVDVVALEDGVAATNTKPYAPYPQGGMRKLVGFGSVVPQGCGDFWASPEVLNGIPEEAGDRLTVQRLPVTVGGEEYQAIRFDYRNEGLEMALVYDLESGLMLYHTMDYTSLGMDAGVVTSSRSTHAIYELKNLRKVNIPWADGSLPSWLEAGQVYYYQGQSQSQIQGAAPVASPLAVKMSIGSVHDRFAEAREDTISQDQAPYVKTVYGVSQLMGGFIPPEASSLGTGIVDTDPDTGMRVAVIQNDASGIALEMTNQVDFREVVTYDSSGQLLSIYQEYNPDVITSSGFGSVRVVYVQLVG